MRKQRPDPSISVRNAVNEYFLVILTIENISMTDSFTFFEPRSFVLLVSQNLEINYLPLRVNQRNRDIGMDNRLQAGGCHLICRVNVRVLGCDIPLRSMY